MNAQHASTLPPCCEATTAWVREHATAASCPDCGEQYGPIDRPALLPAAPTVETRAPRRVSQPGAQPDARVQVADEGRLRPSSVAPVERTTHVEGDDHDRTRRLLIELRPDKGGPLGWAPDAAPPKAADRHDDGRPVLGALAGRMRVQTSIEVPAILPGAFTSAAGVTAGTAAALRIAAIGGDVGATLGWLQRHGTLAKGLRALYSDAADALVPDDVRVGWKALPAVVQVAAKPGYGRRRVTEAMAVWWGEAEAGVDLAPAETAADRAERVENMVNRAANTGAEVRRAVARARGRLTPEGPCGDLNDNPAPDASAEPCPDADPPA